jgi:hypothetical protein
MSEPTFEIVFRGKLLRDFDRATVVNNLTQLLRIDAARAEAMLGQAKLVLKRGLSKDAASRYQEVLRQAGVMVAAIAESSATPGNPASTATEAAPAPVSAPVSATPATAAPARAATAATTTSLTLAAVGTPVLEQQGRPAARNYDLSAFTLDAPGTVLVVKKPPPPRSFDTSMLELEPAPAEQTAEAAPSELSRKLFGD